MVKPFSWSIDAVDLSDLKHRLIRARFPAFVHDSSWRFGVSAARVQELQSEWMRSNFSDLSRRCSVDAFQVTLEDIKIHFVFKRAKTRSKRRPALLLLHGEKFVYFFFFFFFFFFVSTGWPGSFLEFETSAQLLSKRYDVVVPSLPGFGFSEGANLTLDSMASIMVQLMQVLKLEKYVVQGGDLGAPLASKVCDRDSERCIGQHLNFMIKGTPLTKGYFGWLDFLGAVREGEKNGESFFFFLTSKKKKKKKKVVGSFLDFS